MRTEQTADNLDEVCRDLSEVVQTLQSIAGQMRKENLPCLLLHTNTATNKHLKALWDWSRKIEADAEVQFRAFHRGQADRARHDQAQALKKARRSSNRPSR